MVRPRKLRHVGFEPGVTYFKPRGIPLNLLQEVDLSIDELEALRLADLESLSQVEAADRMKIHQSTFHRALAKARSKVSDALVNGKAIKIQGGEVAMPGRDGTGPSGRGNLGGPMRGGLEGECVCPRCGHRQPHTRGQPCADTVCTKCGSPMARG